MACAIAAFPEASVFDHRVFAPRDYRRAVFGSVVIGLGSVVAACLTIAFVTVSAAWLVAAALSGNPYVHPRASIVPDMIAVNDRYPPLADAADFSPSTAVLTNPWQVADGRGGGGSPTAVAPTFAPADTAPPPPTRAPEHADDVSLPPPPSPPPHVLATPAAQAPVPPKHASEPTKTAKITPQPAAPTSIPQKHWPPPQAHIDTSLPAPDSRTAVYDIEAHTVYLPGGDKLEAHSGLGMRLDDPRYISEKNRGPTPPNVYDLVLRSAPFHGVHAIRLNPVSEAKMFGREGMLAHTYMLGPTGQSFGCVSFKNYPAFLQAFLEGEVDRLIVVPHLGATVSAPTVSHHRNVDRYVSDHG
jgi:hypothetical protein